jgi:hypothetical protein
MPTTEPAFERGRRRVFGRLSATVIEKKDLISEFGGAPKVK